MYLTGDNIRKLTSAKTQEINFTIGTAKITK